MWAVESVVLWLLAALIVGLLLARFLKRID